MMVKLPPGMETVSVGGVVYAADRFGIVTVPDGVGQYLIGLGEGFAEATERPPGAVRW